jgi:hypothetical protein
MLDIIKSSYEYNTTVECLNCGSMITKSIISGYQLIIEPISSMTNLKKQKENFDVRVTLNEIPKSLNIFKKIYYLRGIVNFISPSNKTNMEALGHYVSFNWRETENIWERYDDLIITVRHA